MTNSNEKNPIEIIVKAGVDMNCSNVENMQRRIVAYEGIMDSLKKSGLNPLMMVIHQFYNAPVLLADTNSRVIFQYPLQKIGDFAYDTILKDKALSEEYVEKYISEYNHTKYDMWEPFYANTGLVSNYPRLYGVVRYYGVKQATLAIFLGEKPVRDCDLEIMKMFIEALEVKLKQDIRGNLDWIPPSAGWLQDILSTAASPYLKRVAARSIMESLVGDFTVMVSPIGDGERQKNFAAYATTELMHRYRNLISVVFENHMVTLIGEVPKKSTLGVTQRFISEISEYLYRYELVSGISSQFQNILMVQGYYEQALLTAQIAIGLEKKPHLFSSEISSRLLYHKMANANYPFIFLHPLLKEIDAYDKANTTQYFDTLKSYTLAFFDKELAASKLYVHRNTLVYRLNRLIDLFSIDLDSNILKKELFSSFALLDELSFSLSDLYNFDLPISK